jgi:hypothetical protein
VSAECRADAAEESADRSEVDLVDGLEHDDACKVRLEKNVACELLLETGPTLRQVALWWIVDLIPGDPGVGNDEPAMGAKRTPLEKVRPDGSARAKG